MKVIALDIGGTSIKSAIIDNYNIIAEYKQPTRASEGIDIIMNSIYSSILRLNKNIEGEYGIAISSAGDIDPHKAKVIFATDNLPNYSGCEIGQLLTNMFHMKVTVINDAMAALIGETAVGAAKNISNSVMLTLGTGLGGAAIVNGKLLLGHNCRAGRFGHLALYDGGRQCTCGRRGCIEQYVSATGLIKTARELGLECKDCNEIGKLASTGDGLAVAAIGRFTDDLAKTLLYYDDIFDPQVIIIGGGLVEMREAWWNILSTRLSSGLAAKLQPAMLGNKAGILGAYEYFINSKKY